MRPCRISWSIRAILSGLVVGYLALILPAYGVSSEEQIPGQQPAAGQPRPESEEPQGIKKEDSRTLDETLDGVRPSKSRNKKSPKTLLEALIGKTEEDKSTEQTRLAPDRPHLPEASMAVGRGRWLLEGGYTFIAGRSGSSSHGGPETLLRVGMLADWFEFRIGQNFLRQQSTIAGVTSKASGAQDLYLGVKFAVSEQKRYWPELALVPQMSVPTGNSSVSGGRALPGVNVDSTWEITERFALEVVVGANRVAADAQHSHLELATGITPAFKLTEKLEAFVEWDAFYPRGSMDPATASRHYAVGGLVFFGTRNLAIDFRAGAGLNAQANRFLIGAGFAFRR